MAHAMVIHADIHDLADAKWVVDEEILPMMQQAPGFLASYFVAIDDSHGLSLHVFETEEQARAVAPPEGATGPGATLAALEFGEVIASA